METILDRKTRHRSPNHPLLCEDSEESNRATYRKTAVVKQYAGAGALQPPEVSILNLLRPSLPDMTMLDIGVGGGRTTQHFAPFARDYVGVDYSEKMIDMCRRRFSGWPALRFEVCDAQCMERFADAMFDFILFSFNGIDYLSHAGRLRALREIHRIGKPGGYFAFSTHNLQSAGLLLELRPHLSLNPVRMAKKAVKWFLLRHVFNRHIPSGGLNTAGAAILNDGAHRFGLRTYYISPMQQLAQLSGGFRDIRAYELLGGQEIAGTDALTANMDDWLYYLCRFA